MTTIKVYGSHVKIAQPLEVHHFDGSLNDWMLQNVTGYKPGDDQPITATCNGKTVDPKNWDIAFGDIEIRPNPQDATSVLAFVGKVILAALVSTALNMIFGKKAKKPGQSPSAQELSFADVKANQPKLNQIIPEIAGRHRVYPDYLNQPRRYFVNESTQVVELMLSVGVGEFTDPEVRIGETEVSELGASVDYEVFGPGVSVSSRDEHECWYNAPEVGPTTGGAGIRLQAGVSKTETAALTNYNVTGSSILATVGSGVLPQDWESGMTVEITINNRTISVVDGGGSWPAFNRDLIRGDFGDLSLAVNDIVRLGGMGANEGRYRIYSISSVTEPGTASYVTAVKITPILFDADPITFSFNGETVILDEDYTDFDDLIASMNAQLGGATASHSSGVVTITDDSPYDGVSPVLAGYFDPVFGSMPTYFIGTKSQSYDEITLDSWQTWTDYDTGTSHSDWAAAGSLISGNYTASSIQKVRLETVTENQYINGEYVSVSTQVDFPNPYRITSVVTGLLPDGNTGTTGFVFQRLLPDGTDDATWAGFSPEGLTPNVEMTLQASNVVGGWVGPFVVSPKDEYVNRIEYDVFAPNGIVFYSKSGNPKAMGVGYEVQYRIDGGSWVSTTHSRVYATQSQLGWTNYIDVDPASQNIEMRVRRTSAEYQWTQVSDRLEWYGARTRLVNSPTSYAGITSVAMKITGSDVISAQVDNQINMLVTRKLDGVAQRNIVPWVKYVLSSIGVESDNLDSDEFDRLHDIWSGRGDYFDYAQLSQNNVRDVVNRALGAGYAEVSIDGGLVVPVRDEAKTQYEQSYSAQNFTSSLKRSFSSIRPDEFDGVDVIYLDPVTFVEKTIQYRLPGDLGYKAESIRAEGVNDPTRAWRIAARRRREQKYRRWVYEWGTEMDAFNSRYMGYCAVVDDVPGYGRSGWIKDAYLDGATCVLQVSEPFEFEVGQSHVVAWRDLEGALVGPFSVSAGANDYELIAATTTLPEFDDSAEPPHVYFGTTTYWCHPVLISKIAPEGMTSCKVSAFNYDARVYADDDNLPD